MSFIYGTEKGRTYRAGDFLAVDEPVTRKTKQIAQTGAVTADDGAKYVPMGTIYPSNDANAIGIVYEDVDVTSGDMPGSVVTAGTVYTDKLPTAPAEAAKTALEARGFKFIATEPTVTRPY